MKLSARDVDQQLDEKSELTAKIKSFQKTPKANRSFDDGTKKQSDSKRKFKK